MTFFSTLLYFVTFFSALILFLLVPKVSGDQSIVVWLPVAFIVLICIDAVFAGLFTVLHIPANTLSTGCANLALSAFLLWRLKYAGSTQSYHTPLRDYAVLGVVVLIVAVCAYLQFGLHLSLSFFTSDPAVHLHSVMNIVDTQSVSSMYLAWYFTAMVYECVSFFLPVVLAYKVFIACEIFYFIVGGLAFYSLISRFIKKSWMTFVGAALTVFYMLGYPLNNMIFGFCYLGVGVSVAVIIVFVVDLWLNRMLSNAWAYVLLAFGFYGLCISYILFAPTVFLALLVLFCLRFHSDGKVFTLSHFLIVFALLFLPLCFGGISVAVSMFQDVSATTAISFEGSIYRDLYSNFIVLLPFVLFSLYVLHKKREIDSTAVFFLLSFATICISLPFAFYGVMSTYYFSKFYYLIWPFFFALGARGLFEALQKDTRPLAISYCAIWCVIGLLFVSGIDKKLSDANVLVNPSVKSSAFFDLYDFNRTQLFSMDGYSQDKLDLYSAASDYYDSEDSLSPLLAQSPTDVYWYEAVCDGDIETDLLPWNVQSEEGYIALLQDCDYVVVLSGSDGLDYQPFSDDDEGVVFENSAGYIVRVAE